MRCECQWVSGDFRDLHVPLHGAQTATGAGSALGRRHMRDSLQRGAPLPRAPLSLTLPVCKRMTPDSQKHCLPPGHIISLPTASTTDRSLRMC